MKRQKPRPRLVFLRLAAVLRAGASSGSVNTVSSPMMLDRRLAILSPS